MCRGTVDAADRNDALNMYFQMVGWEGPAHFPGHLFGPVANRRFHLLNNCHFSSYPPLNLSLALSLS